METHEVDMPAAGGQTTIEAVNAGRWATARLVHSYARRRLRRAETELFARHAQALSGDVLELGCGGGRITGHLIPAAASVTGLDLSPAMVAFCRRRHPEARFVQRDLRDLGAFADGQFSAVVSGHNTIDVLDDAERRRLLDELHRVLAPEGVVIFSSHNLACESLIPPPSRNLSLNPVRLLNRLMRMPEALRNRTRLGPLQRREQGYAILNDTAHDYSLLHYYIGRDGQEAQLAEHCFRLLECVELDGTPLGPGDTGFGCHELHYVAQRVG
jgi:SAM-dependent methyltransferase